MNTCVILKRKSDIRLIFIGYIDSFVIIKIAIGTTLVFNNRSITETNRK